MSKQEIPIRLADRAKGLLTGQPAEWVARRRTKTPIKFPYAQRDGEGNYSVDGK